MPIKQPAIIRPLPPVQPPIEPREEPITEEVEPELPLVEPIRPPEEPIFSLLRDLYPEMFLPEASFGFTEEEIPQMVLGQIVTFVQDDPEGFLVDLYERDAVRGEQLLEMLGVTPEEIGEISAQFVDIEAQEARITELVTTVFPDIETPEELIEFATESWDLFIVSMQEKGRSKETQDLLRLMGFEWEDIGKIFAEEKVWMDVDGVRTLVTVDTSDRGIPLVKDMRGRVIGEIDPAGDVIPYQYRIGDTWEHFTAGVGDVIATAGGALKWLGADGMGENLSEFGQFLQLQAPPDTLGEFEWSHLFNPRFYATRVTRTMPFTLTLIPAMIAGKYAGLAVAAKIGLGKFGTFLLEVVGAALFSRPMESALEAGGAYDRAIEKGLSEAEAREAANSVFFNNLALVGVDAAQLAVAFAPMPIRTFNNLIVRGLVTTVRVGGRLTITGLTEAGEELYQEIIQRVALGEDVVWDAEMREVVAIGGIIGIGFGAAGEVWTSIIDKTQGAMPTDARAKFDADKAGFIEQGFDEKQATIKALDLYAETEEGQKVIRNVLENEEVDALEKEIRPKTEAEEVVWEQTLDKMREEITPIEVPAVPEVIPSVVPDVGMKQPWQMTGTEYDSYVSSLQKLQERGITEKLTPAMARASDELARIQGGRTHRWQIETALTEGKAVPAEVLAEYPDLKPPAVEVAKPPVEPPPVKVAPTPEEISKTRQTIMSWVKQKGLTQKQFRDIFMEVGKHRQLHLMTPAQLESVLAEVRVARPVRVKGKRIVTRKTERKIETLKDTLIRNKQLTEKSFDHIVEQLNLPTTRYETATKFITETEAKSLIRAMNDEAVLAEWDIKVEEALDKHPNIKTARDAANARSVTTREVDFDGEPIRIRRGHELRSMRYYVLKLQKELKAPIYDVWQKINMAHLAMRQKQNTLYQKLENTSPEARRIMADEVAARRVEDYIAAKHKMAKIKSPPDITANEISLANELERQLFEFRNDVRYARFTEAYAGHSGDIDAMAKDIPDAPKRALRRAIDVFEGKGANALRTFLDTQEWGVIRTGYDPRSIIKPKLHLYPSRATTFAKGHIQTRRGTEYTTEDRSIFQRYRSYTRQMMGLTDLSPLIRAFDRVFTEHAPKLAPGAIRETSKVLSRGMNEMKGYREDGGFIIHALERLYAQVASAVFWRPDLVLRNKFQNWAFNPDYHAGLFLRTRPKWIAADKALTEQRRLWFEVFVSQKKGIEQDYLLYLQKALPGFDRITRLSRRTSLYPWSDKSNRAEAFLVRINRVDRALARYEKDGDVGRLIKDSGLVDFEARQQAEALELLAMDEVDYGIEGMFPITGAEAFARYNAQQLVNNVHFLYDRAQRAPAEMGASGKTLGNILVFTRSWGERLILQGNKLNPKIKVSRTERIYALRTIVGIIVCGMIAGMTYRKITGKDVDPYNPLNILTWTPGGLIVGVAEDISNMMYLITQAAQGDEGALAQLPGAFSGVATMTLPFYKNLIQFLDALTDTKDIDVLAYRKVRELLDDEYEVRGGTHEVERTLLEKFQRALFALKDMPETPQEKLTEAEEMLGQTIEEEDLPYSIEEPDTYDMKNLNTVMGRNLKDVPLEDITKANDYSELARAWKVKENTKDIYDRLPNRPLYKIDDFEALYSQWQDVKGLPDWEIDYPNANLGNLTKRQLEGLRKYFGLEGAEQKAFLEKNPWLKVNPANEWLEAHPKENAMLAVWGQAKIFSIEAYNEFNKLIKELDIPDDAIPKLTLPPKGSVDNYFKFQEASEEFGSNSWEVKLILAQDDDLRIFLDRQPIDTPIEALKLKIANRELDEDSVEFRDNMRRIEAYENATSKDIVEKWVERGKTIDEFGAGSSQAKVWLLDNPETHKWALDNKLLSDDGSDWNENILRINVEIDKLDPESDEYKKLNYRRDAYSKDIPKELIDTYVEYYTLPIKPEDWPENVAYYEEEWFLQDNPELHQALVDAGNFKELKDLSKVPTRDIFKKLWIYNELPTGYERDTYRLENPDLDEWGVSIGIWKTTMSERRRRLTISEQERFEEDVAESKAEFDRKMREIEELLASVR